MLRRGGGIVFPDDTNAAEQREAAQAFVQDSARQPALQLSLKEKLLFEGSERPHTTFEALCGFVIADSLEEERRADGTMGYFARIRPARLKTSASLVGDISGRETGGPHTSQGRIDIINPITDPGRVAPHLDTYLFQGNDRERPSEPVTIGTYEAIQETIGALNFAAQNQRPGAEDFRNIADLALEGIFWLEPKPR